jgi:hypothetical protein
MQGLPQMRSSLGLLSSAGHVFTEGVAPGALSITFGVALTGHATFPCSGHWTGPAAKSPGSVEWPGNPW